MSEKEITKKYRTPIVAVMGHVDHGKTTLLDKIRGTKVAAGEIGGITQVVRAHQINYKSKSGTETKITFIDTPGHEAFSAMRSRGSQVADMAIIVVGVDDGVQPQTKEAIKFAKEQNIPIIVALNKIDLPHDNILKLKNQLVKAGIITEEMGGDDILIEISAKTGQGVDDILETICLLAEMHELKNEPVEGFLAEGIVLESNLSKQLGPIALVILRQGIVDKNVSYIANNTFAGKVRSYLNEFSQVVDNVEAGDPIWISGMENVLEVGQVVRFFKDKTQAYNEINKIKEEEEFAKQLTEDPLEMVRALLSKDKSATSKKVLNIILKTDTQGSLEVVKSEIAKIIDEESEIRILEAKVGEIAEGDIIHAKTSGAIIIGFRAGLSDNTKKLASREKILIRDYQIIYELIEELEDVIVSMQKPQEIETEVSRARVKQVFVLTDKSVVAGCVVTKGTVTKGYRVLIERDGVEVGRGRIDALRVRKDEIKEVEKGRECGILISPIFADLKEGDFIVPYKVEKM